MKLVTIKVNLKEIRMKHHLHLTLCKRIHLKDQVRKNLTEITTRVNHRQEIIIKHPQEEELQAMGHQGHQDHREVILIKDHLDQRAVHVVEPTAPETVHEGTHLGCHDATYVEVLMPKSSVRGAYPRLVLGVEEYTPNRTVLCEMRCRTQQHPC